MKSTVRGEIESYRFGEFVLDRKNRVLQHAGLSVDIEPKIFECLELLVSRAGSLTTSAHLRAALWPGLEIGEGAVRRVINGARKALAADSGTNGWIRTRKRLGYTFVGPSEPAATGAAAATESPWPFIGRETELGRLGKFVHGHSGVCFVAGEAGAGKSTLLSELRKRVLTAPTHPLLGRCQAGDGVAAFWPWREIASQILALDAAREPVRRWLEQSPRLGQMIPELRGAPAPAAEGASNAAERFDCCDAFVKLLQHLARIRPFLIVIDDVHWADDGSVLVLELLARSAGVHPISVIASYRPEAVAEDTPLGRFLGRTVGREGIESIDLEPLTVAELHALLTELRYPGSTRASAEALRRLTGGNPLFAEQLLTHTHGGGTSLSDRVPTSLQHIVTERVRILPDGTRLRLQQAAVLGETFTLAQLAAFANTSVARLQSELQPALNTRVLRVPDANPFALCFAHALVSDALYASLPAARRRDYHRRALRACDSMPAGHAQSSAQASHAFLAGDAVNTSRTRELCERAGREALEAAAFDRAAVHLERAVQTLDAEDVSPAAISLILLWARALWTADRPTPDVEAAFMQAATRARRSGAAAMFAEAAIGYAIGNDESTTGFRAAMTRPAAIPLLEEAFAGLPPNEGDLRYRLAQTLTVANAVRGDQRRASDYAARGIPDAPENPKPLQRMLGVWMRLGFAQQLSREHASQILAQRKACAMTTRERIETCHLAMPVCLGSGDLDAYEALIDELDQLLLLLPAPARYGRLGEWHSSALAMALVTRLTVATVRGELVGAERRFAELPAQAQRLGLVRTRDGADYLFSILLQLHGYRGSSHQLEGQVDQFLETFPAPAWHAAIAKAQCALERGARADAMGHFDTLRKTGFRAKHAGSDFPVRQETLVRIADLCSEVGNAADARTLYPRLAPHADFYVTEGALVSRGSYARPLGALAALLGEHHRAESHFRHALIMNERMGHRPECVRTRLGLADVLLQRRDARYAREAREQLRAAREEAAAIGMVPMSALAARLAAR